MSVNSNTEVGLFQKTISTLLFSSLSICWMEEVVISFTFQEM